MSVARLACASDLPSLLSLFDVSEVSAVAQPRERAESIWRETLAQQGVRVFVSDDRDRIAATCMLVSAPNLLRGGRRHGFLENVVTHPELRGQGHGKAVVLGRDDRHAPDPRGARAPANSPSVLKSSSNSGQWIP
jgi:GNAT superfamily N-acetyltransferase